MLREIRKLKAVPAAAIALSALMATTAMTAPAAAGQAPEKPAAAAAPSSEAGSETALSSAAAKALRLIGRARESLLTKDVDAADRQLGKALGLLDLVQASLPGRTVEDETWTTRDRSLVYQEADIPLNSTRRLVSQAQEALRRKDVEAARAALDAAEDNVVYLSVVVHEPLVEAHRSLWRAARDYAAGAYDDAKSEVDRAVEHLGHAMRNPDEETRKAAQALSNEAQSLKTGIGTKSAEVPSRLEELWQRAKAVSERAVDYVAAGVQRVGTRSGVKADLIEAKLHLSYAEIARFTTHDVEQAAEELGLALSYMDDAIDHASDAQAPQIRALRDSIDALAEEPPADRKQARYAELRGELDRVVEARAGSKEDTVPGGVAALAAGNYETARQILEPLAESDSPQAAFWLADMYEYGLGVPKNVDTAVTWYRRAAEGGWIAAKARLGDIYFHGTETEQDFAKAHKWLEQAANAGDSAAQQELGQLYANGWGVKKDPIWAYVWYEIGAREGNYRAQHLRDALIKTMSEGDIAEAQKLTGQIAAEVLNQVNAG